MDGNSNSATLVDDRRASARARGAHQLPFRGPAGVDELDFAPWDEQRDTLHATYSPLSVAGFVRLGGLNRLSSAAKRNQKHQDDEVLPFAHVESSFPSTEPTLGNGTDRELLSRPPDPANASSVITEADSTSTPSTVQTELAPELTATAGANPSPTAAPHLFLQLHNLSNRVKAGDDSAMAEIHRILDSSDELWRQLGDVEKATEVSLIELAEGTAASKESVRRSVATMKQSLLGEQPTPLERMAVGRVVACWLFAHLADRWCGFSVKHGGRASDLARLLEAAEKRYGTALKTLKLAQEIKSPGDRGGRNKSAAA